MRLFKLLLLCSVYVFLAGAIPTEDDEEDCCQLEWLPLVESKGKHFIPSNAFIAGWSVNGSKWYYIKKSNGSNVGIISDSLFGLSTFIVTEPCCSLENEPWTDGLILSNPNECDVKYELRSRGPYNFQETALKKYPRVNGHLFSRVKSRYFYNGYWDIGSIGISNVIDPSTFEWQYLGVSLDQQNNFDNNNNISYNLDIRNETQEVLSVICSLTRHLHSELYDIDFDQEGLLEERKRQVLKTTEVINYSDTERIVHVTLDATIYESLHFPTFCFFTDIIGTSRNLRLLESLLARYGGYLNSINQRNLFETVKKNYTFSEPVKVEPMSKTKVSIVTYPIIKSQIITTYSRFVPSLNWRDFWTEKRIIGLLQRHGYDLTRLVNGTFSCEENISIVDTDSDTQVVIESHPLHGNSTQRQSD